MGRRTLALLMLKCIYAYLQSIQMNVSSDTKSCTIILSSAFVLKQTNKCEWEYIGPQENKPHST